MTPIFHVLVTLLGQNAARPADHPFAGHWTADVGASRFNGAITVKAASLDFAVQPETVAITNHTIDASDRELGTGTTIFITDRQPHQHDELLPGLMVVARWSSPQCSTRCSHVRTALSIT